MARKKDDAAAPAQAATKTPKVKKRRWYHQVWDAYKMTVAQDPAVRWWVLGTFAGVLAVAIVLGIVFNSLWFWGILGVPTAVLAAMFVLARRAERAAYARIEGQPGATLAALGTIRRGWTFDQEPVFIDPRTHDAVFRGVGRPGVVLFVEAPASRAQRVGENERKRTARVLPNVPVTVVQVGREAGQVPLPKLVRHVTKLKPAINKHEISVVLKRLQALGTARLPIPKGVDPMRMRVDRKGMRGR